MKDWKSEFEDFLREEPIAVPRELSLKILAAVKSDLEPKSILVFFRLCVLHLFSGALTLTVCPQFGVGPIGGGDGLMGFFMHYGILSCALGCGIFFLGTTALVSLALLTQGEQRTIYRHGFSHFGLLGGSSIAVLMVMNRITAGEWFIESLPFIGLWLVGGTLAGFLVFALRFGFARKNLA